jgi:hypothetical protein
MSCHFAIEFAGRRLIIPEIHCLFLGREDGVALCEVYERRFEEAPWCQTADEALARGFLAHDCPYAAGVGQPGGGKRWATAPERAQVQPHVRKALVEQGLERKFNPDSALKVLTATGERWSWRLEGERYRFVREDPQPRPSAGGGRRARRSRAFFATKRS